MEQDKTSQVLYYQTISGIYDYKRKRGKKERVIGTSASHPIQVDFLQVSLADSSYGTLGMTLAPGKKQPKSMTGWSWNRDVKTDLIRIKEQYAIDLLVTLMRPKELRTCQMEHIFSLNRFLSLSGEQDDQQVCDSTATGEDAEVEPLMDIVHYPINDGSMPTDMASVKVLVDTIVDQYIKKGRNVCVHCKGGLGRTGTITAACCVRRDVFELETVEEAIAAVRASRRGALKSSKQAAWVKRFWQWCDTL